MYPIDSASLENPDWSTAQMEHVWRRQPRLPGVWKPEESENNSTGGVVEGIADI